MTAHTSQTVCQLNWFVLNTSPCLVAMCGYVLDIRLIASASHHTALDDVNPMRRGHKDCYCRTTHFTVFTASQGGTQSVVLVRGYNNTNSNSGSSAGHRHTLLHALQYSLSSCFSHTHARCVHALSSPICTPVVYGIGDGSTRKCTIRRRREAWDVHTASCSSKAQWSHSPRGSSSTNAVNTQ